MLLPEVQISCFSLEVLKVRSSIFISLASLIFTVFSSSYASASFTVKNGGDGVVCKGQPGAKFQGIYALDYLVTYDEAGEPLVPIKTWEESAARITAALKAKVPELAISFQVFAMNFLNKDPSHTFLWEPASFGLIDLKDEELVSKLPENCRTSPVSAAIVQAIIRQPSQFTGRPPKTITFSYDPKVLENLYRRSPLQLSFLLVHEWLWEHSQNVERNRRLNRYIHSTAMERFDRNTILSHFRGLGFIPELMEDAIIYEESCKPEPSQLPGMFPQNDQKLSFGEFQGVVSRKTCGGPNQTGCLPIGSKVKDPFQDAMPSPRRGVFLKQGGIVEIASVRGTRYVTNMTCQVDFRTARLTCTELINAEGYPVFTQTPKFTGTISRTCVRLKGEQSYSGNDGRGWWVEEKFVIFRKF